MVGSVSTKFFSYKRKIIFSDFSPIFLKFREIISRGVFLRPNYSIEAENYLQSFPNFFTKTQPFTEKKMETKKSKKNMNVA